MGNNDLTRSLTIDVVQIKKCPLLAQSGRRQADVRYERRADIAKSFKRVSKEIGTVAAVLAS